MSSTKIRTAEDLEARPDGWSFEQHIILMESGPRAQAFPQPLAAQLSMLLVVHEYVAIHASRYPKSISVVSGTGLIAPTF